MSDKKLIADKYKYIIKNCDGIIKDTDIKLKLQLDDKEKFLFEDGSILTMSKDRESLSVSKPNQELIISIDNHFLGDLDLHVKMDRMGSDLFTEDPFSIRHLLINSKGNVCSYVGNDSEYKENLSKTEIKEFFNQIGLDYSFVLKALKIDQDKILTISKQSFLNTQELNTDSTKININKNRRLHNKIK